MSKLKRIILILLVMMGLSSCDILEQMLQMSNFANCDFKFASVSNVQMLGITLNKDMKREDLTITQALLLTKALVSKSLPVTFNVNLDVTNPNSTPASMVRMDYLITLNDKQVVNTTLNNTINVPANGSNVITIPITTDLFQVFTNETGNAIANLAFKLAGASSDPVNVGIQLKPYINVGTQQLAYPDFITLNKVLQ